MLKFTAFKRLLRIVLVSAALLPAASSFAGCGFKSGSWGLFLSYPGAGFKYFSTAEYAIAPRILLADDITAGGLRGYRYFQLGGGGIKTLAGWEFLYFNFKGEETRGGGYLGGFFLGGEYFITERLCLELDFGPQYIYLRDRSTEISLGDFAFAVNITLNRYFNLP